jgi:hypothetical protein
MQGGELRIPADLHSSGHWMGIWVSIANTYTILMVLDTGSPVSAVSRAIATDLQDRSLLTPTNDPRLFGLADLTAEELSDKPPLPDVTVCVLPRLTALGIAGLLGLDFFRQFDRICFDFPTSTLILLPALPRRGQGRP